MNTAQTGGLTAVSQAALRSAAQETFEKRCGAVYADSISVGYQSGEGWQSSEKALLMRHFCGFTMISGNADSAFLEAAGQLMRGASKRFLLFAARPEEVRFFRQAGFSEAERYFYTHRNIHAAAPLPDGFSIHPIDRALHGQIQGHIVPAFSWHSPDAFLAHGYGFCVMDGNTPAAWAFSAAVSSRELDIGVETNPAYRRRGLAFAAASAMILYSYGVQKIPVWACHTGNIASQKLAASLGFVRTGICKTFSNQGG